MEEQIYPSTEEIFETFGKDVVNEMFAEKGFNELLNNTMKDFSHKVLENFEDWARFDNYDTEERAFAAFMFIERWHVKQLDICARLHISGKTYRKIRDASYTEWMTEIRQMKTRDIINTRNLLAVTVLGNPCLA